MKREFDEFENAKNLYDKGLVSISHKSLTALARYVRQELGYGDKRVENVLLEYCYEFQKDFSPVANADMIAGAVKYSVHSFLKKVDQVDVYKHEMDALQRVKDFKMQVFVLSMIIYCRVHQPNSKTFALGIDRISEVIDLSNIKMSTKNFIENYYFLLKSANVTGHRPGNDFFYLTIPKLDSGEIVVTIDEFSDIRKKYIDFVGSEIFYCKLCEKSFEKKAQSQVYCKKCSGEIRKEKRNRNVNK